MIVHEINNFIDVVVVDSKDEDFKDLDTKSEKGIVIVFDATKLSLSKAEQVQEVLVEKLVSDQSPRLAAIDFTTNYVSKDKPPVPITIVIEQIRSQYSEVLKHAQQSLQADKSAGARNVMM